MPDSKRKLTQGLAYLPDPPRTAVADLLMEVLAHYGEPLTAYSPCGVLRARFVSNVLKAAELLSALTPEERASRVVGRVGLEEVDRLLHRTGGIVKLIPSVEGVDAWLFGIHLAGAGELLEVATTANLILDTWSPLAVGQIATTGGEPLTVATTARGEFLRFPKDQEDPAAIRATVAYLNRRLPLQPGERFGGSSV